MSEESVIQLEFFLLPKDFDLAGEASSKVKQVLQRIGIHSAIIRRIAIGTYEGEMNAIIHAVGGIMRVNIFPGRTEILINDEGPGIADVELAMTEGYSTAPDYIREMGFGAGMGLPNMVKCADKFEIISQPGSGTRIQMVFQHELQK